MVLAPDLVIACPHCRALARLFQFASGDSFGAITWTDGWQDVPLLPRPPRITRCHSCGKVYWTGEAAALGFFDPRADVPADRSDWGAAPHAEPLDEAGLMQA